MARSEADESRPAEKPPLSLLTRWKARARQIKSEGHALYLAYRDPRVPWHARIFAAFALGYLFSPIDLIPDFIPVIGYLDDLLLVPLFILIARKLIPPEVLAEHREFAQSQSAIGKPTNWVAATVIILVWLAITVLGIMVVIRLVS